MRFRIKRNWFTFLVTLLFSVCGYSSKRADVCKKGLWVVLFQRLYQGTGGGSMRTSMKCSHTSRFSDPNMQILRPQSYEEDCYNRHIGYINFHLLSNPRTNGVSQNRCFSRSDIRFFRTLSRGRDQLTSYIVRCKGQIGLKMYFLKLSHNMKCGMVFLPFCSSKWRQTCRCFGNTVNRNLYRTSFKLKHKTF